jgi:hypothetical protein
LELGTGSAESHEDFITPKATRCDKLFVRRMGEPIEAGPRTSRAQRHDYVWLAVILVLGFALRAGYLHYAVHTPDYSWQDPDGYIGQARHLVSGGEWRWTFDAVTFRIKNRRHALPPGYSVFLSIFAGYPSFPLNVQIALLLVGTVSIALLFELGRLVHSPRAGLIAAGISAVAVHNIIGVWSTNQESVYVPLVLLAFILTGRAMVADARPWRFAVAGFVFGLAALTRSMPLFFLAPMAAVLVLMAPRRQRGAVQALALVAGFLLPTVPYSVALSSHFGEVAIIDTHGSVFLPVAPGTEAASIAETAAVVVRSFVAAPGEFLLQNLERARSLLHINGGRILQIYVVADSYVSAVAWKAAVHAGTDLLLILSATLAPLGAAMCRQPRVAVVWLLWAAVNVGITSVAGFSGARMRAPFEPLLIVLAAVVISGGWCRRRIWLLPAAALSLVVAAAVLPQVPRSLAGWPDYGIEWPSIWKRGNGRIVGPAGVSVPAFNALAEFAIERAPSADPGTPPAEIEIRGGGVTLDSATIVPGDMRRFKVWWPSRGLAFLHIEARRDGGAADDLRIVVDRP